MSATLYVGNLAQVVSEHDLVQVFSCAGEVLGAKLQTQRPLGDPHLSGYVTLRDASSARRAMRYLNGRRLCGSALTVKPARPSHQHNLLH